ncbi:hypothetical protein GEV33_002106 [Tenebrio molitor]|uniref:Transposon Ty3-I Gag-Pol polyprotein n=1 Tax=Tenebrio molitor TaxID=7067 RepID=A0A8J6LGB4_TENMO|nr:hypothetical protein GEV33_002106 [Tenebrio molitor]
MFKTNDVFARAWPCVPEKLATENVLRLTDLPLTDLPLDEIKVGPITSNQRLELIALITEFRDRLAPSLSELGCAKSTEMEIRLTEDKPFSYKPYRMARSEQEIVKNMVDELLEHNIVRESDSNYCSPVLLVKKKNGEQRLCIDYRKLNTMTMTMKPTNDISGRDGCRMAESVGRRNVWP